MPDRFTRILILLVYTTWRAASGHAQVHYTLSYLDSLSGKVRIEIRPDKPIIAPLGFVMPRSIPGNYAETKYDAFVEKILATDNSGNSRPLSKDDDGAPRWYLRDSGFAATLLSYVVDINKMEGQLHAASDKSITRPGFACLLNYSVFGWIDGYDRQPVVCSIHSFPQWPVFSTIVPSATPAKASLEFTTSDYYALADAQTYLGPRFRVKEYKALVPLFIVDFSETKESDLDNYGWMEMKSLAILKDYFGEIPFPCYTALFRETIRRPEDDPGNFAMEHLQSSTFFGDTVHILLTRMTDDQLWRQIASYLHHMAHAFIPLRCYGDGYHPYVLEIPPIINNIWFNEGFMWYIVEDTTKSKGMMDYFRQTVFEGPAEIRQLDLRQLSQIASTQYAEDFRLGQAVFSRGALMAADINDYVKRQTGGKSSMRTVYRYLYEWSRLNRRAFTLEEFPELVHSATGVDVTSIYEKWQLPISDSGHPH